MNGWQAVAIVALIAATAGWTTVAVLALRDPAEPSSAIGAAVTPDPNAADEPSSAAFEEPHDVPELEALLPTELTGTALLRQSWDGDIFLTDDAWSTSMNAFLKTAAKVPADLQVAQAYDAEQTLDASVWVYRVAGTKAAAVQDALIAAWKGDYTDMTVSQVTLDGKEVTKAGFGEDVPSSYLYQRGDLVYDIEAADDAIAIAAIAAIAAMPAPGASSRPAASPTASASPAQ
jgi:hypothetical protein